MTLRLLPYNPERDAYRLLGVPPTASLDEIGAACRRLARTFHPDHNVSPRANQEMQVVNAVRRVMSDPEWRAIYDRERRRFHAARFAGAAAGRRVVDPFRDMRPLQIEQQPTSPIARYARALAIGVRATVSALAPPRCLRCRTVIERADAYCVACGTPLLAGG
jgi:curved DNA-binding protein CbpA